MNSRYLLYRRTLRTGISVGVIGILVILFSNVFMVNIGTTGFADSNGLFYVLTQIYMLASVVCMPFSAALLASAIVMRYLGPQPMQEPAPQSGGENNP